VRKEVKEENKPYKSGPKKKDPSSGVPPARDGKNKVVGDSVQNVNGKSKNSIMPRNGQ
jgi:hypothetical protein